MAKYHKACEECVLSGGCLLQDDDDVKYCEDVQEYEVNKKFVNDEDK